MTVVHRCPAGLKLLVLAAGCIGLFFLHSPVAVGAAVVAVVGLYAVARVGRRAAWAQLRPMRWLAPLLFAAQWVLAGPVPAATVTVRLLLAVALAGLVTLTTSTTALLAAFETALRPLRTVGVDPARVALLMALTVRSVPVVSELAARIREAQRARGCERSVRAFAVPLVVGTLRQADALGEALAARGVDD